MSQRVKATVSIRIKAGWNVLQNASARGGIGVPKHFEASKADPGRDGIGVDFQRVSITGSSGRPVPHIKVIVAGEMSDRGIARVEGESAFVAGYRFAPASLPPIDATNVIIDLGVIGRSRRGDLELLKSCVVILLAQIETKAEGHVSFAEGWR